jgi:DNA-directed RNA polymerase subunit K/omega
VDTAPQEKPLSIALREINADLVEFGLSKEAESDGGSEPGDES